MMETGDEQVAAGIRRLPTLQYAGREYFIDNRLREFRTATSLSWQVEFIGFDEPRGRQMLKACVWLQCGTCHRRFAVSRRSTESVTWCPECRRWGTIPEVFREEDAEDDRRPPPTSLGRTAGRVGMQTVLAVWGTTVPRMLETEDVRPRS